MSVVDTNVLVHASAIGSPHHGRARLALERLATDGPVAVTRQILREFLSVTTRPQPWAKPATVAEALQILEVFQSRFAILEDGPAVWDALVTLGRTVSFGGKQVHDANIVATMLAHGETRLLTFNVADFRRFEIMIELLQA